MRAGIVVTGTELLTGATVDRNGPWVARQLGELGAEVAEIVCVGDRPADLEAALRFMAEQGVRLVVTTGGLGPTADDLTAEVVARFAGRELVLDERMEAKIGEILSGFARRLRLDPEALRAANRKQAMVPAGAATVDPAGTAPGLVVPSDGMTIVVLPGPPRELQAMWPHALATEQARAALRDAAPTPTTRLRLFGVPESEIAQTLRDLEAEADLSSLEITTCLRQAELEVDIRHRPGDGGLSERVVAAIRARHGRFLYSETGETVDEQLAQLLHGRRLGVAESCTGGLLAARLTARPGASQYVAGAVVAYADGAKVELLGVPSRLIASHGAVSPEVAEAMADGALDRFGADVACSITGVAGPSGGTAEKPVGYVCVCVKDSRGGKLVRDPVLPGRRADVRERATAVGMHLLRHLLRGEQPPL